MPRTEDFNRSQVLDKAKSAFWTKGYNGTSMQDLVDATGLNRSSIYNSFGSKMELFQESLKQYQAQSSGLFDKAMKQKRNAIETIGLIFVYLLEDILADVEKNGCMMINCHTEMGNQDSQLNAVFSANQDRLVNIFQDLVLKGQADGSIRKTEKSELLAYYLVSAFQGLRITGMNTADPKVLKSIIQNVLKTVT